LRQRGAAARVAQSPIVSPGSRAPHPQKTRIFFQMCAEIGRMNSVLTSCSGKNRVILEVRPERAKVAESESSDPEQHRIILANTTTMGDYPSRPQ